MSRCQPVILACFGLLAIALAGCGAAEERFPRDVAPGVRQLGRLSDLRISESSGVVASRRHEGVFWTHNDGGGPRRQILYAINRKGDTQSSFAIAGAIFQDWEDIAIDDAGHLFVGDIGNNDAKRPELAVYQIDEPNPAAPGQPVLVGRHWQLHFPGAPFDCESLFIWQGYGYVISKVFENARAQIFRFPLTESKSPAVLELVATTRIESPVTGADISPDGKRLGIVAKNGAYVFRIDGDVARVIHSKSFHTRFKDEHVEGCCFVPDGLLATSENRDIFLFTNAAFRGK
ncbi:MAG: hypothetical protein QOF48_82 [Verrucomicrobiota bacterium]|jgi:hypothetical protein